MRSRKLEISYLRKFHNDWVLRNKAKLNPKVCKGKIGFFSWKELCDENIMGIKAELIKLEVKGLNWESLRSWGLACNLPKTFIISLFYSLKFEDSIGFLIFLSSWFSPTNCLPSSYSSFTPTSIQDFIKFLCLFYI